MGNLAKSAAGVMTILLLSKGLGFLREILLAYQFGTSYIVDAYAACAALPSVLFTIFASGFSNSYVTVYTRISDENRKKGFFNDTVTVLLLIAMVLSAVCFVFSSQISALLAPGFEEQGAVLLTEFIQLIVIGLPFMTVFNIIAAHLSTKESFIPSTICDYIVINLVIILGIMAASERHPETLIYGEALAWVIATFFLGLYARKRYNLRYRPSIPVHDSYIMLQLKLAIPLGASRLISELNGVSDRIFASLLGEGVTSALSYANRVQSIFYTLTTSVFLSVCYPRMNRCFAAGDKEQGMYYVRKAVMLAAYISIPAACGLFVFAKPMTALLFERGSFTADSTAVTAGCLAFYALGIPFYALRETAAKALGANMQQKKIMKNTILSVVFNILLNLTLYRPLGHIGLALATSLTGVVVSVLAIGDLRKIGLFLFERGQVSDFLKISGGTALALAVSILTYRCSLSFAGNAVSFILTAAVAVLTYGISSIVCKIEIFIWLYQHLPAKIRVLPWLN